MGVKVSNNAFGTISAGINSSATTVTLDSGQGARFPSLGGSDHFYGTLIDTSNNVEIIKVTARSTDSMTVTRAQDNTSARAFAIGDRFELRPTAALFEDILSEAVPAADTIVNSMIATDAVNADSIAADAVGASELNVSGNGSSGNALLSDGDGTFSWGAAGNLLQTAKSSRTGPHAIQSSSFVEISTNLRVSITIKSASSLLLFICYLGTETDSSAGHGLVQVQYSTDGGSSFTTYDQYNMAGSGDDAISTTFTDYFDHSFSVGTTVIFKVQYRMSSYTGGQNHTIADTGPGETPKAQFIIQEVTDG
jgi:hypothetical protein